MGKHTAAYHARYYAAHRDHIRQVRHRLRQIKRDYVDDYLRAHPCARCGYTDIRALQFHHLDPRTKRFHISSGIGSGISLKKLRDEIEKTEVLCANCHAIVHRELAHRDRTDGLEQLSLITEGARE